TLPVIAILPGLPHAVIPPRYEEVITLAVVRDRPPPPIAHRRYAAAEAWKASSGGPINSPEDTAGEVFTRLSFAGRACTEGQRQPIRVVLWLHQASWLRSLAAKRMVRRIRQQY